MVGLVFHPPRCASLDLWETPRAFTPQVKVRPASHCCPLSLFHTIVDCSSQLSTFRYLQGSIRDKGLCQKG